MSTRSNEKNIPSPFVGPSPVVGILALQGCIEPHCRLFEKLGVPVVKVRSTADLATVDRLVMPGGESTTMLRLLDATGLFGPIQQFAQHHPVWGICAGAILAAREVCHPTQRSLALAEIRATRNFYGSQLESFTATIAVPALNSVGRDCNIEVDFIRAPRLEPLNDSVEILGRCHNDAVLLRAGHHLFSSFHVELSDSPTLHRYFVEITPKGSEDASRRR